MTPSLSAADASWSEAAYPAAVGLMDTRGEVYCSGALVSPQAILTAAHCLVQDGVFTLPHAVYGGADARRGGSFVRVQAAELHPDYDDFLLTSDLALLRLVQSVPDVTPIGLVDASASVGAQVRIVGYGVNDDGVLGIQRVIDAEVTEVSDDIFRYEPGSCFGDSGGPVLSDIAGQEHLLGVVSAGSLLCSSARAVSLSPNLGWVASAIDALDPIECRGTDGVCAEDCAFGDLDCPCASDGVCELCQGDDPDCSTACGADGACAEACLAPDPDCRTLAVGDSCARDVECGSGLCEAQVCRALCDAASGAGCAPFEECVAARGPDEGACVAVESAVQGCSSAGPPRGGPLSIFYLLVAAALAVRRRRNNHEQCNH